MSCSKDDRIYREINIGNYSFRFKCSYITDLACTKIIPKKSAIFDDAESLGNVALVS
jgi:hypothetical protein